MTSQDEVYWMLLRLYSGAMKSHRVLWILIVLVLSLGCGSPDGGDLGEAAESPEPPAAVETGSLLSVITVNYPLQYFAERIGGELVQVSFPAPPGEDPAYWAPGPEVVADYQEADLILLNGVDYAKWRQRATLPIGKMVDTSAAFEDRWLPLDEGPVHSHGPEGEHSHKGWAFTTWVDPQLAMEQARAVAAALTEELPEHEAEIQSALEALLADLQSLDQEMASATERIGDQPLLFSHPVYQYLEARFGLNGRSLHWEPSEPPTTEQWRELEELLSEHPSGWMIWEAEPSAGTAERLASLGVESVVFSPSANRPQSGDYLTVMQANLSGMESIGAAK